MVEERLEHGDNSMVIILMAGMAETDQDGNFLVEAEEFVCMMEAEMFHSQHIDPTM